MNIKVKHYANGNINSIEIKNEKGELHNTEGPACQTWYENGQEECRRYYVDNEPHNTEGPAVHIWYEDGQEVYRAYYVKGKTHNTEGPAFQEWYENGQEWTRGYYVNDILHNMEGPALQEWHENGRIRHSEYRLNGERLTKEEWEKKVNSVEVKFEGKTVFISKELLDTLNLI